MTARRSARLAVYSDIVFGRGEDGELLASETFALFAAGFKDVLDSVVLVGREGSRPLPGSNPVRGDVEFCALPHYASLADGAGWLRGVVESCRRFWRVLDDVDAVWLLGPHPLAVLFALLAGVRGRQVVLGVRQDLPAYVRARHPRRPGRLAAAWILETTWRWLARRRVVVTVGTGLAQHYRRARAVVPCAISLVESADIVGLEEAMNRREPGAARTVLSVTRLDPEKNPLLLPRVLAELRERDAGWRMVICGDGMLREALHDEIERLGLQDECVLLGSLPLRELAEVYRSCEAFVHVSYTEGVPQVLFEAFAAGTPVVATDVGGVRMAVGDAALLVPPEDAAAVVDAVLEIAGDAALRRRLVARGLDLAIARTGTSQRLAIARAADWTDFGKGDNVTVSAVGAARST